ncbi:MAG: ABC transporter permease [Bdellovibrio sp. ArHS]|uniref:ABC transporter permease n=1 Tax=Bdellovibrio sp. ArHS TaxID=1569284 RepID=UPI000583FA0B|nr:FtsX-like permease family protein [Bdellovibrio sp. ArHS]KHD89020.1 MAG: ABC transporter permease [Bdellovibrio sp. ArHS]
MLFRLAFRELLRSWRFGSFFIFNLSLGLTGFVSLQAFNTALEAEIAANAKSILSADLAVSARRELTEEEVKRMRGVYPSGTAESKVYEFFAMISSAKGSRLVLVKAIDQAYPFYGELELESGAVIQNQTAKSILNSETAWIYPELKSQLGLDVGDEIKLGNLNLKITDLIKKDATQTFRAANLAPRVFINRELLPKSGLLQFGSTFSMAYLLKFPANVNEMVVRESMYHALIDPGVSVETPSSAGEDSGRQLGYLSDYLGLVSIVALFMSALGAAYIYRLFLSTRMKEIAILRTLGLQSWQAVSVYILQASLLGLIATIPTLLLSHLILPILSKLLASFTPFDLQPQVTLQAFLVCLFMAVFGSFIVSLPFLVKIFDLRANKLFSEEKFAVGEGPRRYWPFLPSLILFYFLSVYQAHSWKTGSAFVGALIAVILLLLVIGYATVKLAGTLRHFQSWYLRFSFLSLSRRAGASLAIFVALGLGALLINILPQLKNSLQAEFQFEGRGKVPSLFMFDIQDEQLSGVQKVLQENQVQPLGLSPLVRARILKVNGQDYERKIEEQGFKTREEEREARFRNRGINLSYRHDLSSSEYIVEGRPFSGSYNPDSQTKAELSVEVRFADRMGFHVGDTLVFDVQGVEVEGQIINLRKVKWTSFQPNFFILVQNGVLNEAPKTWIAAVPFLSEERRAQLQNEMAAQFSNVSVIDVVRTVDDVLKTAEKMSWSLELMAALALVTGYIVLFSIVRSQIKLRRWELNMLKILGASGGEVACFILAEFAFLAFLSALAGALLSIVVSFSLNTFIFESDFKLSWSQPLTSVALITALSLLISFLASLDIVKESALGILREEK